MLLHMISLTGHTQTPDSSPLSILSHPKSLYNASYQHTLVAVLTRNNLTFRPSNNFFHYYDFNFPPESETNTMKTLVRNPEDLNLLSRLNQHDRLAGTFGILPNHLIQLVRSSDSKNVKKILDDLRLTTFWSTYHIWTKHQTLNRTFWKIIPECCKIEKKNKKPDLLRKKRKRRNKKLIFEDCKNPFHYLPLKKNLEPIKGTCSCGVLLTRRSNLSKTLLNFHHPQPHLS